MAASKTCQHRKELRHDLQPTADMLFHILSAVHSQTEGFLHKT